LDGFRSDFNGDHAVAEESFRAAVADDPYFAQARFYLASSLMKEKNSREAIAQSSELLQQYPYYPKIKLIKAIAEFDLGDTTAAFRDIADEMTMETEPLTLYYASFFHYKMNDPAGEYRYVSALAQNSIKSRNNEYMPQAIERLSIIGLSMHDTVTCSEMFPRIRNAFPDDGEILAALCEGYGRLGNYNDARSTLALALSLAPTDDAVKKRLDQIRRQLASMP